MFLACLSKRYVNMCNVDAEDLKTAMDLLKTRHLVVLADLRETILDDVLHKQINNLPQALDFLTVNDYIERLTQPLWTESP